MPRDFDTHPYTPPETRAAELIAALTNNAVGGGEDPVGFLIASYRLMSNERRICVDALRAIARGTGPAPRQQALDALRLTGLL